MTLVLRPYQERGVAQTGELWQQGVRRILLQLPTGGGKTVIGARFISGAIAKGKKAIFFAHRREIVQQTFWKLRDDGVPLKELGCLMGDEEILSPDTGKTYNAINRNAPCQVASIAAWSARHGKRKEKRKGEDGQDEVIELPPRLWPPTPADVVFIDEAHHCTAATWKQVIDHYVKAGAIVIGLTATPQRADGRGFDDLFDRLIQIEQMSALVEAGYLCRPRVWVGERPDGLSNVRIRGGDYVESELQKVMDQRQLVGDLVESWKRYADNRSTVVFATGIDHSRSIAQRFVEAGIRAEHLDGETPVLERDAILRRLRSGETQIVTNAMVLTEGWDEPRAKCCVLARPTKSLALYLQMAGRVLRPWNGVGAIILDHTGEVTPTFGPPDIDREWRLEGREKKKKGETRETSSTPMCEDCHFLMPVGLRVCPECGHEKEAKKPVVEVPGELKELQWQVKKTAAETSEEIDELRRRCARLVYDSARELGRSYPKANSADVVTEINRAIFRRLRKSRTKATASELQSVIDWIADGSTGRRDMLRAVVVGLGLDQTAPVFAAPFQKPAALPAREPTATPQPAPAAPAPQPQQKLLPGFAPPVERRSVKDAAPPATTPAAPKSLQPATMPDWVMKLHADRPRIEEEDDDGFDD